MSALDWLILSVATWRLAYMLLWDDGLFGVFDRLRAAVNRAAFSEYRAARAVGASLAPLFACIYCMSVWTGAALLLAYGSPAGRAVVGVLVLSGGAVIIHAAVDVLKVVSRYVSEESEHGN